MHPSFGIEFTCPSTKWEDVLQGPSQAAVLAHTYKVLHYRTLFAPSETVSPQQEGGTEAPPVEMEEIAAAA